MIEPERIPPQEARKRVLSGQAMLVCAYEDDEKYKKNHLEGGVSLKKFKNMLPSLPSEQELIFY